MAIKLENKPNVKPPDSNYPYGSIRDKTADVDGTPVTRMVYDDMHQFFMKLADEAGVSLNDLPDNEANGFQLITALLDRMRQRTDVYFDGNPSFPNTWNGLSLTGSDFVPVLSPYNPPQFCQVAHFVYLRGVLKNTGDDPQPADHLVATLDAPATHPALRKPIFSRIRATRLETTMHGSNGHGIVTINNDGEIRSSAGDWLQDEYIILDGMWFSTKSYLQ